MNRARKEEIRLARWVLKLFHPHDNALYKAG